MTTHHLSPILSSVVHHTFSKAMGEVGCSLISLDAFTKQMKQQIPTAIPDFPEDPVAYTQLYRAVLSGEVMLVEKLDEERMAFLVRGGYKGLYIDVRLMYCKETWEVTAITSVHARPMVKRKSVLIGATCAAIVVAGIVGFLLPGHSSALSVDSVEAWAQNRGYTLMPQVVATQKVATPVVHKATPVAKPKVYSFVLKKGMTVHDISVYLEKNHLIPDAFKFDELLKSAGVDRKVQLGTFTFKAGMTEKQLMDVLRHPTH